MGLRVDQSGEPQVQPQAVGRNLWDLRILDNAISAHATDEPGHQDCQQRSRRQEGHNQECSREAAEGLACLPSHFKVLRRPQNMSHAGDMLHSCVRVMRAWIADFGSMFGRLTSSGKPRAAVCGTVRPKSSAE